ncbi:MAG: hypothetical protein U9R08_01015 [Nanoarchaeota archaeon]|nr:hypothetical protein [Nanoarchaeota archaeon]
MGGGVSDFLKGCKSFVNNSSALKAKTIRRQIVPGIDTTVVNFSNLKSQAGFKLAEMIEDRKISITATALEKEVIVEEALAVMRQKQQGDDKKLALIPKDSNNKSEETVKGYLGRSPDI